MGKRFIISESEKNDIRKMYGLIKEQSSGSLVPQSVYDAIEKIESVYSYMDGGEIKGATYSGNQIESEFSDYIKKTIGLDNWSKINEKLRGQIYAYAFQADSGKKGMTFRWIAGLANAIDSSIKRLDVVNKQLTDPNVQNAINVIKKACKDGSINSHYNDYLNILDQQYKSGDYNNNYKYIWKYRPTAIDRFMNGEDEKSIFQDWEKSFNQSEKKQNTTQQITPSTKTNTQDNTAEYDEFAKRIKTETENASIDLDSIDFEITDRTFTFSPGNRKIKKIILVIGRESEGLNMNQNFEQKIKNIRNKNPEYTFTPRNEPGTCRNCLVIKGKPTPIVYQLFIMEEKNNEIESQYGQEQQTNSDDLTDF